MTADPAHASFRAVRLTTLWCIEALVFAGITGGLLSSARHAAPVEARAAVMPAESPLIDGPDPELSPAQVATGTFLGMSDELLMARMRVSEVRTLHFNRGGSSVSFRVDFVDGSRAAFKPTQTNPQSVPRKEAAAYRLGKQLGLRVIAPTVMRTLRREDLLGKLAADSEWTRSRIENETIFDDKGQTLGALMYWIPQVMDLKLDTTEGILHWSSWLSQGSDVPHDKAPLLSQLSSLLIFDLIQNNSDRFSGGNVLGSADGRTLYFMDNAFGFQADSDGHQRCWSYLKRAQKFSRSFVRALAELDKQRLQEALTDENVGPLLSSDELDALLSRRDGALKYVNGLIREFGEAKVLVFP